MGGSLLRLALANLETICYNQRMQKTVSECEIKQMSNTSRRPHQEPLILVKKWKQMVHFTQTEDCKNVARSDESQFEPKHSELQGQNLV